MGLCDEISVKHILSTLCCLFICRQNSSDLVVWVDAKEERRCLWQLVFLRESALTATWWLKTSVQLVSRHVSENICCLGPQSHKHRTGLTSWPLNKQVLVLEPEQTKGNKKCSRTDLRVWHWSWFWCWQRPIYIIILNVLNYKFCTLCLRGMAAWLRWVLNAVVTSPGLLGFESNFIRSVSGCSQQTGAGWTETPTKLTCRVL